SPSPEGRRLMRDLVWAAQLLMIQVLDDVIIGHNTYYSFADEGSVRRCLQEFQQTNQNPVPP
ncbi:MAG: hypothetical protein MUO52_08670, partial [Desulfobacterales bacterium]|nr:hypothetical protein [Desulfobacterales bacterium]